MESTHFNKMNWKTIAIQNLEPRPQIEGETYSTKELSNKANRKFRWGYNQPYYYSDTGASNERIIP